MCSKYSELRSLILSFSKCNKMGALCYGYYCTLYYLWQNIYTHCNVPNHILLRVSRTRPRIARRENSNVRCRRYFWFVELKLSEAYARKYFWNSETSALEEDAESETVSELDMVAVTVTNLTEGFWLIDADIKVFEDVDSNKQTATTRQEIMRTLACCEVFVSTEISFSFL
jgi:hypothetical protein